MSLVTDLEADGIKIADFLKSLVSGAAKIRTIFSSLSGPTLAVVTALSYDVLKCLTSAESAAATAGTGDVQGAITLSKTTLALVQQLVADAKAGEKTIVSDFEMLNIKF